MGIVNSLIGNASNVSAEKLTDEYGYLLTNNEKIEVGYKVLRDTFIFTNMRLILVDVQGVTGRKIQYLSIFYGSITRFAVETAGRFDLDAELKIWISSETTPSICKKFSKNVNIYDLQKVLAYHLMPASKLNPTQEIMPIAGAVALNENDETDEETSELLEDEQDALEMHMEKMGMVQEVDDDVEQFDEEVVVDQNVQLAANEGLSL